MFETILVTLNTLSNFDNALLQQAINIAENSNVKLILVCSITSGNSNQDKFSDPYAWRLQQARAEKGLDDLCNQLAFRGIESTSYALETWNIHKLNELVQRDNVGLIMTAKSGDNIDDHLYSLLKTTSVPVLAIPETISPIRRILVPLDGSSRAECTLPATSLLTQQIGCDVVLFHVVQPPHLIYQYNQSEDEKDMMETLISSAKEKAESYLQNVAKQFSFQADTRVVVNNQVCSSIHKAVEDEQIDLIVISAHGESGQPQWPYGSTTHNLIAYAQVPVFIIQDMPDTTTEHTHNLFTESLRQPRQRVVAK